MRTGYGARTKVLGAALLASLGGGALGQAGGTLEGTLYAPTGQTVAGATVVACFPEGDGCDEDKSVAVTVKGGSSAPFRLAGLGAGPYAVIAFKDMNDDDDLGDGDLVGAYSKNGDEPSS
jgi:uncharacterized protein (DUF2141 family)